MRKIYALLLLIALFSLLAGWNTVFAADPDFTIPVNQATVDAVTMGIKPGDVVCLQAGTRTTTLRLLNFKGSASKPIIVKNCGGQVVVDLPPNGDGSLPGTGIAVSNSSYVRLTGSGDPNHEYGIDVAGAVMGVAVGAMSKHGIEVDHISVHDVGFAGIILKTDPNCEPATWRENFPWMENISVHDNYVYHTLDGEGFYIGFTFVDGYQITCNGQQLTVFGHLIKNLEMYNNRTEDTGSEGIQISSAPGARIHHNVVIDPGQRPFADYQNNGIQVNYQDTFIYNNWIQNIPANGLILFGTGHQVYNNVIIDAGDSATYADDRKPGKGLLFAHNTLITPGGDGLRLAYDETTISTVKNNLIVAPGEGYFVKVSNNVKVDESNNIFAPTIGEVGFVDAAARNYHLTAASLAVEAGTSINQPNIHFDYDNLARPQGLNPDAGAFEWKPVVEGSFTELLTNSSFEADTDANKIPDGWKVKAGGAGKLICNKTGRPGKPDKIVAYDGLCAYQLKGGAGIKTKISQSLSNVSINAGDWLRLAAYFNGKKVVDGAVKVTAKVVYPGDVRAKYKLSSASGSYDYSEGFNLFAADQTVSSIKVMLQYTGKSGKIRVDKLSLGVNTSGALLPLPESVSSVLTGR